MAEGQEQGQPTGEVQTDAAPASKEEAKASFSERVAKRLDEAEKPKEAAPPKEEAKADSKDEKPKMIPHEAFHKEREERKRLAKELAELKAKMTPDEDDEAEDEAPAPKRSKKSEEKDDLLNKEFMEKYGDDPLVKEVLAQRKTSDELRSLISEIREAREADSLTKARDWYETSLASLAKKFPELKDVWEKDEDGSDSLDLKKFHDFASKHNYTDDDSLESGFFTFFRDRLMSGAIEKAKKEAFEAGKASVRTSQAVGKPGNMTTSKSAFSQKDDFLRRVEARLDAQNA